MSVLVHPDLFKHLAPTHYTSSFTLQDITIAYDSANEPVLTYVDSALLANIPGYIEPVLALTTANEIRRKDGTIVEKAWNIVLAQSLPQISEEMTIKNTQGEQYNILNASVDLLGSTRLMVERVDPLVNEPS